MITRLYSHTHKEMMFRNCLYLKMFCRWPCLYVDVFHKCNKESLACCCPASVFDAVLLLMLVRRCLWSIWSCMINTFWGGWWIWGVFCSVLISKWCIYFTLPDWIPYVDSIWWWKIAILNPQALHTPVCWTVSFLWKALSPGGWPSHFGIHTVCWKYGWY